jgi:hypothetical protein
VGEFIDGEGESLGMTGQRHQKLLNIMEKVRYASTEHSKNMYHARLVKEMPQFFPHVALVHAVEFMLNNSGPQ